MEELNKTTQLKSKRIVSEETRKKMSESHKGICHTEESKRKISESKKGKKHVFHYSVKRKLSEETRKKLSEAHKGHVVLQETKVKMSKTRRRHNREKRNGSTLSGGDQGGRVI